MRGPHTELLSIHHTLPSGVTTRQAYQRCVEIWRDENLGLPWFVPPPFLKDRGDPVTGVGLEVVRIPPLGLREGIVDCHFAASSNEDSGEECWMEYKVLNPSWLTWPVQSHLGRISFRQLSTSDSNVQTELEWRVQWVPLPLVGIIVGFATRKIVSTAARYLATTAGKNGNDSRKK